ncbi:MAG: keratin [Kiloniellales bacterium]|nr:keratin [Kiloniellales bacterium]
MTLGLYEERTRRRRARRWATLKWLIALGAIGAAGIFAYESGSSLAQRQVTALSGQIADLESTVQQLEAEKGALEAARRETEQRLAAAEARYQEDVPTGALADLLTLVRGKLDEGVEVARLGFLIGAAQNQRDCDEAPVQKRFLVKTPLYAGGNDSVGFADGLIRVTGEGESALTSDGKAEAWFDDAKPITLRFIELGGKETEAAGVLPLSTSIVIGEREYRFSVSAGARGFVQVTGDSCQFP